MAITRTGKTTSFSSSVLSVLTTASITPTANALVIATLWYTRASSLAVEVPTCSGNGLTWVLVKNLQLGANLDCGVATFAALGSAPSPGPVTFTFSNAHGEFLWEIGEYTGPEISTTQPYGNVASAQTTSPATSASPLTITMGAFSSASNRPYGVGVNRGSTLSGEASWTSLESDGWGSPVPIIGISRWHPTVADTTFDVFESGAGTSTPKGGYAFEIGTVPPPLTGTARLTQLVAETLILPAPPPARLTQLVVETLGSLAPSISTARLTQLVAETLTAIPPSPERVTQLVAELLNTVPNSPLAATQVAAEILLALPPQPNQARVTQFACELIVVRAMPGGCVVDFPTDDAPSKDGCSVDFPVRPI